MQEALTPLPPNRNKGSETHMLKCCKFAGWDSEEQFTLGTVKVPLPLRKKNGVLQVVCGGVQVPAYLPGKRTSLPGLPMIVNGQKVDTKDCETQQETSHKAAVRLEQRDVDIAPGERLSIVVGCRAK